MAAGLAVVGTDIEGIREVVGASGVRLLAPPGDADELARIVLKLAGNAILCSKIGEENRQRITESFNSERMCEETTSFLINLRNHPQIT
jgi:glycosyltransferase involved in cell wall biosynthesis